MEERTLKLRIGELEHKLEVAHVELDEAELARFFLEDELGAAKVRIEELENDLSIYEHLGLSYKM